jgi:outer membrane lipoprotein SlyB
VIESVRQIEKQGEGSGAGAAVGALLGGVLGHQTGAGHGRDAMTVLGAIGGAVAGHQIEKNANRAVNYQIVIRFEDGTSRVITQDAPPAWRPGDKVKLVDGTISANL